VLVLTLSNVICLVYIYGFDKLISNMEEMIGPLRRGTYWYLKITWYGLAPIFVLVLLIYFFVDFPGTAYDKPASSELFPSWVQTLGVVLAVIPICFIPIVMVYQVVSTKRKNPELSFKELIKKVFSPKPYFASQLVNKNTHANEAAAADSSKHTLTEMELMSKSTTTVLNVD
jgi:amino acid permease